MTARSDERRLHLETHGASLEGRTPGAKHATSGCSGGVGGGRDARIRASGMIDAHARRGGCVSAARERFVR